MSDTVFVKGDKVKNFTVLDNSCLQDSNVSWGAKGLHSYLESLPGDWKIIRSDLYKRSSDKRYATDTLIDELVKNGYITIEDQQRTSKGRFGTRRFIVYEKNVKEDDDRSDRCWFSAAGDSLADSPLPNTPQLLNTNVLNTNVQKTKLTNCEVQVSESVYTKVIKELFGSENVFDNQFETDILKCLDFFGINQTYLEKYLKYVFERTKKANPVKSFEGLFRKLALSSSILSDFELRAEFMSKPDEAVKPIEKIIVCPICHTKFEEIEYYCPVCSLSVSAIKEKDEQEIKIKSRIFNLSTFEREKFDAAYAKAIKQKGRGFLSEKELLQFYKEYGIL